mgnify:CR=1 FL=1
MRVVWLLSVGQYNPPPMQSKNELIVEPIGLDPDALPRPINWSEMFGNGNPVEIEIGMGKGTFLTEQAKARPDVNFFGIEWARWFWRYASDRLRRNKCDNARTVRAEASFFLTEFVPPESLSVLHIYFPDPWPKARHHKRRLIQEKFVPTIAHVLRDAGYSTFWIGKNHNVPVDAFDMGVVVVRQFARIEVVVSHLQEAEAHQIGTERHAKEDRPARYFEIW